MVRRRAKPVARLWFRPIFWRFDRPRFISRLVNEPAINSIRGQVESGTSHNDFRSGHRAGIANASAARHCVSSTCHSSDRPKRDSSERLDAARTSFREWPGTAGGNPRPPVPGGHRARHGDVLFPRDGAAADSIRFPVRHACRCDRSSTAALVMGMIRGVSWELPFVPQITRAASPCLSARSGLEQTLDLRVEIHGDREC